MPHGAIHPGSLPRPPLIAREIPWRCSNDGHRRWDDREPALEQPEREETCISVSWKQTDRHVWVSSADPWRKAEAWKAQWWSVHSGVPASSCTTWHGRAPRSLQEGLAATAGVCPALSRPGRGTQGHEAFSFSPQPQGEPYLMWPLVFTINGKEKFLTLVIGPESTKYNWILYFLIEV